MTALLEVKDLAVRFALDGGLLRTPTRFVHAVDGVSLTLARGEVLAVVGESGCGKTTLARAVLALNEPSGGTILYQGQPAATATADARRAFRRSIQMIFQDPFDSLNPRKSVLQTLAQPLRIHGIVPPAEIRAEAARLLDLVGLSPGADYLDRYPHQFSGGQRQRICIARAIAPRPQIIVADEAVSALDISIRAQILKLMRRLQRELGLSYLFITHDLGVVRSFADRVAVMYLGRIVEEGPTEAIFTRPAHPYTAALLASCPIPDPARGRRGRPAPLTGDVPSPVAPPPGCRFHTRCAFAIPRCRTEPPAAHAIGEGHISRCHLAAEAGRWRVEQTL